MRKLASIQRVLELTPIEGADRIELATVLGWQVVVKKGDFKVNDLAVFFEIDSVLPDDKRFSWLWQPNNTLRVGEEVICPWFGNWTVADLPHVCAVFIDRHGREHSNVPVVRLVSDTEQSYLALLSEVALKPVPRPANFRIRTKKLKKTLSQGLLMPVEAALPNEALVVNAGTVEAYVGYVKHSTQNLWALYEGAGVAEILGVTKYEPSESRVSGMWRRASTFPTHLVSKTYEERVQSAPGVLKELDGMSATYVYDPGADTVIAASRNYSVEASDENVWGRMGIKYGLFEALKGRNLAIQGEICGPAIQGNKLGLAEPDLFVFNAVDTVTRQPLLQEDLDELCISLGLKMVPILYSGESFSHTKEDLLAMAEGKYPGTKNQREGLVIRPSEELVKSKAVGGRLSFKVISNKFLLAESD